LGEQIVTLTAMWVHGKIAVRCPISIEQAIAPAQLNIGRKGEAIASDRWPPLMKKDCGIKLEAQVANDQPAGTQRTQVEKNQEQGSCLAVHLEREQAASLPPTNGRASKTRSLYSRADDDAKETELSLEEDCSCTVDEWDRSHSIYPW
jgi:hypothetical protein